MDSPLAAYAYTPLSDPRAIRVLILEPSTELDDPIRCRLEQVSLDDATETAQTYEALSYVWGAPVGTRPIECAGGTLMVTPNCESALRHLRQARGERALWIDAVCIDQASASEKAVQVPLMGDVYAHATRVLVWLGPGSNDTSRLCRHSTWARPLTELFHVLRDSWWRFLVLLPVIQWLWCHVYPGQKDRRAQISVASNEWFRRVWTIQEVYFARDAVLVMGRSQCSYRAFISYTQWYGDITSLPPSFNSRQLILEFLIHTFEKSAGGRTRAAFRFLPYWFSTVRASNAASNQRDTVYGMLGILASYWPEWTPFPVDYELSPGRLYEMFAKYLVRHTGTLNVMEQRHRSARSDVPLDGLPSWVPDMRGADLEGGIPAMNAKHAPLPAGVDATPGSVVDVTTLDQSDDGEIRLRGKLIGEVGSPPSPKLSRGFEAVEEWMNALADAGLKFPIGAFLPIPGTKTNILGQLIDPVAIDGREEVSLFLTSHNRLGVAPSDVQTQMGDALVLLAGFNCPAILRPCEGGTYTFVGRVSIEGVMEGEEWDVETDPSEMDIFVLI